MQTKENFLDWIVKSSTTIWENEVATNPKDGVLQPVFFGIPEDPSEPTVIIPASWADEEEKVAFLNIIRMLFKQKRITMYGHASEAWTSVIKAEDVASRHVPPSQDPERQEHLIFIVVDKDGPVAKRCVINRVAGQVPTLGPVEDMPGQSFKGRMMELLDEEVDIFSNPSTIH